MCARLVFDCQDQEGNHVRIVSSEAEIDNLLEHYDTYRAVLDKHGFALLKARTGKAKEKIKFDGHRCPKCKSEMWDNRERKANGGFNPKAPDFSCKDKACGFAMWPGQYEIVQAD